MSSEPYPEAGFLALYPFPVFLLRPDRDVESSHAVGAGPGGAPQSVSSRRMVSTVPTSVTNSGSGGTSSDQSSKNSRILAHAFGGGSADTSELPNYLHKDQQTSERNERTAEGAVNAMYEARAADEAKRILSEPKLTPLWFNKSFAETFSVANGDQPDLEELFGNSAATIVRLQRAATSVARETHNLEGDVYFARDENGDAKQKMHLVATQSPGRIVFTASSVGPAEVLRSKIVNVPTALAVDMHQKPFTILPDEESMDAQRQFLPESQSGPRRRLTRRDTAKQNESATPRNEADERSKGLTSSPEAIAEESSLTSLNLATPSSFVPRELNDPFLDQLASTPVGQTILDHPWHETSLGPIQSAPLHSSPSVRANALASQWPAELRAIVSLTMACKYRSSIWVGEEHVILYNDEYASMAGDKHPFLMGKPGRVGWKELWSDVGHLAAKCLRGETVGAENQHLLMHRHGFLEETWHSWAWIPFRSYSSPLGFWNIAIETTEQVVAERRLSTIRDVVLANTGAGSLEAYCDNLIAAMASNAYDLPFVILYTCQRNVKRKSRKAALTLSSGGVEERPAQICLSRAGTIGIPAEHPSAPPTVTLEYDQAMSRMTSDTSSMQPVDSSESNESISHPGLWPFLDAISSQTPIFVDDLGNRADGFEPRGWLDPPKNAVVMPIMSGGPESAADASAVLVIGLNPRRPFDNAFASFLHLLSRQIAAGILSVTNAERDQQKVRELAQLNAARTTFAQNINHELRTPLQLILGPLADVMEKPYLAPVDAERLRTVQRNAQRLLGMVNTLLDFNEVESGQANHVYRPTDLSKLTADLASLFRSAIESAGLQLIVDCELAPATHSFYVSPELYEKLIFNLLGNAFKYTASGTIEVHVRYVGSEAQISIKDSGIGIAEADLAGIFERFHRVNSAARRHEGSGIGLALAFEIVKSSGGRLSVESQVGSGSTFTVHLPKGASHLPAERVSHVPAGVNGESAQLHSARAKSSLAAIQAASIDPSATFAQPLESPDAETTTSIRYDLSSDLLNLRNSTVVLAEDNVDLRNYVVSLLSKAYHVVAYADGRAAMEHIDRDPPAMVVTDVMMPSMDGNELLQAIRSRSHTALIPVIFLSAQAGEGARAAALETGADDYLCKPFSSRELLARVNVHLQLGKLRTELERRVTERTKELYESETRYRKLADQYSTLSMLSPVGIFMTDKHGKISYTNPRFSEIVQLPYGASADRWLDRVHENDRERVTALWSSTVLSETPEKVSAQSFEFAWERGDHALCRIRPFRQGDVQRGFVGALTDITSTKELERKHVEAVEARARDAEDARRQQEQFIDLASHELRNPVSAVINSAEVLRGSMHRLALFLESLKSGTVDQKLLADIISNTAEDVESVESIALSASHQASIASDILSVSKLNVGLVSIEPVAFSLTRRVAEIAKMFEIECSQKDIDLRTNIDHSVAELGADWIFADPVRISQVILNFMTNSVKFTASSANRLIVIDVKAGTKPWYRDGARRVGKTQVQDTSDTVWISVGVRDTGRGLTPDELERLFARFAQARPRSDQYSGSGLGLYVARKLAELQNGFIEVDSHIDQGSLFRFSMPVTRSLPKSSTAKAAKPGTAIAVSDRVEPLRVLVVEDNLINQRVLKRQLKLAKIEVTTADDGQQAIDILSSPGPDSQFDVVLMDIEMPVKNGLEALRELRQLEREGKIPRRRIIALTGNARSGQIDEFMSAGFDDYALKPYTFASLLDQITNGQARKGA